MTVYAAVNCSKLEDLFELFIENLRASFASSPPNVHKIKTNKKCWTLVRNSESRRAKSFFFSALLSLDDNVKSSTNVNHLSVFNLLTVIANWFCFSGNCVAGGFLSSITLVERLAHESCGELFAFEEQFIDVFIFMFAS